MDTFLILLKSWFVGLFVVGISYSALMIIEGLIKSCEWVKLFALVIVLFPLITMFGFYLRPHEGEVLLTNYHYNFMVGIFFVCVSYLVGISTDLFKDDNKEFSFWDVTKSFMSIVFTFAYGFYLSEFNPNL